MKFYYLTNRADNILHQNSSSLQLTTKACESFHSHFSKYFYHPRPDINLFTIKLKEYQNRVYINLRSVNFPDTATNKRSHVAKGLEDDLIKQYESGEISRLEDVSKVSLTHKMEYVRNVPSKLRGCVATQ